MMLSALAMYTGSKQQSVDSAGLMAVSVLIPAYNEAQTIGNVIESVRRYMPANVAYEVIVVDNGSGDATVQLARCAGAVVGEFPQGNVAAVRNFGRTMARGTVLVFLDADVVVTPEWGERIAETLHKVDAEKTLLTGSWCGVSEHPSWLERSWFAPLVLRPNTHINTGHMVVSAWLFDRLGGFAEDLDTGEDYDFSMRAKDAGMQVVEDTRLAVRHEGYPKTLLQFLKREMWHGRGDYRSWRHFFRSKVAMVSVLFGMLHLILIADLFWLQTGKIAPTCGAAVGALCLLSSWTKYRGQRAPVVLLNALLYYCYYWARALALAERKASKRSGRRAMYGPS